MGDEFGCTDRDNLCKDYKKLLGPIIGGCYECKKDLCNSAIGTKIFYPLLVFGVLIGTGSFF